MTAWTVGQEVVFEELPASWERNGKSRIHPVTLTKVGRVWAHFSFGHQRYRFPIAPDEVSGQFEVDGGDWSSPGRIWRSLDEQAEHARRRSAWDAIVAMTRLGHQVPAAIPTDLLVAVADALARGDATPDRS